MADTCGVRGTQRGQDLSADAGGLLRFQPRPFVQSVRQAATGHQLHHQPGVRTLTLLDDVVDRHHVRIADPRQSTRLTQHTFPQHPGSVRVLEGKLGGQRAHLLDGDLAMQGQVTRPPHRAHPTAAQPFHQLKASVKDLSANVIGHARRLALRDAAGSSSPDLLQGFPSPADRFRAESLN